MLNVAGWCGAITWLHLQICRCCHIIIIANIKTLDSSVITSYSEILRIQCHHNQHNVKLNKDHCHPYPSHLDVGWLGNQRVEARASEQLVTGLGWGTWLGSSGRRWWLHYEMQHWPLSPSLPTSCARSQCYTGAHCPKLCKCSCNQ